MAPHAHSKSDALPRTVALMTHRRNFFCNPSVQAQFANLLIPSLPSPESRAGRFCFLASFDRCVSNGDAVERAYFPCPLKDCS